MLENDGKAAAIAESRYGNLAGCANACVFLLGTGIGGGLIIDHKIVRGLHNTAGEFSFLNTDASHYTDPSLILGNTCSTAFLLNRYKELSGTSEIDGYQFFDILENDPSAKQALDELCTNIAVQITNLYLLLDLEKIAIGGGISRQLILIERIKEKFAEVWHDSFAGKIRFPMNMDIVPCRFSNDANLIGTFCTYVDQTGRN